MASTATETKPSILKKRKAPVSTPASQKKAKKDEKAKDVVEEGDIDDDDDEEGGVKLTLGTEANFEQSDMGVQGRGLLLEDGLDHDDPMYELLPYEEDMFEPPTLRSGWGCGV